ncbi:hypothetical protein [Facilibium subflavum]|nr:hypothetical protein [Facilibium subflavum]
MRGVLTIGLLLLVLISAFVVVYMLFHDVQFDGALQKLSAKVHQTFM